jgi:hypothetical protein
MSKQKPGSSTQKKTERVSGKMSSPSIGINSMMNWLLVLIVNLPFLYSEIPLDTVVSVRYIFPLWLSTSFYFIFFLRGKKEWLLLPSPR